MENKHLEWITTGTDLESDKDALEQFTAWVDRSYTRASVARTVREGWESLDNDDTMIH